MSDSSRIKKLEELEVIGTRGTGAFYNIAELAATVCRAPYAAISLIDDATRWFYASVGVDRHSTPRAKTCCDRALGSLDPLVFEDLAAARAAGTVEEAEFPQWRAYMGAPIVLGDATTLGALFVADVEPRAFERHQINALIGLAGLAVESLRLHESLMYQQKSAMALYTQAEQLERSNAQLARTQLEIELASKVAQIGFWSKSIGADAFELSDSLKKVLPTKTLGHCSSDAFFECFAGETADLLRGKMAEAESGAGLLDLHLPIENAASGEARWVRVTGRSSLRGGKGRFYGCVQDVTELLESRNKASRIAMLDTLTGAYNRRFLPVAFMRKKRKIDPETERLLVMTIDLDNFKLVNDVHGHDVGDQVLVAVAELLRAQLRDGDIVARLGGDEFLVLATAPADVDAGALIGERLRDAAARSLTLSDFANAVTFSIGFCDATAKDVDFATALKRSDLAAYEAKNGGGDHCRGYDDAMGVASRERAETLRGVDRALAADEFEPFYQPKLSLVDGAVAGAEALARWRRPDGAVISPGGFRHALDDARASSRISARMFERALADIGRLTATGVDCGRIAVNVSEVQMTDPEFPNWFAALRGACGVRPDQLEIEITERCLLSRGAETVRSNLAAVRAQGVRAAFDDFGTGYASMTHLLEFEIDVIKIDMSFVRRLTTDPAARGITGAIVQLARSLELEVVAEGVETREEEEILAGMGCHVVQGFYYAKPLAYPDFVAFMDAWSRRDADDVA